jgi:hypothetical protein
MSPNEKLQELKRLVIFCAWLYLREGEHLAPRGAPIIVFANISHNKLENEPRDLLKNRIAI